MILVRNLGKVISLAIILGGLASSAIPVKAELYGPRVHIVIKGDCLWNLSKQYQVSIDEMKRANNQNTDIIYLGQRLIIPREHTPGPASSRSALSSFTDREIELLARTVHGEARGESFEGQVAVAAVILNRLKSYDFPNTVLEVVYQPRAFTAVDDGQINMHPDLSAYEAVGEALRGWDPSDGALYYFNPDISTSRWIWSRTPIKRIGNHVFAK